MPLGAVIGKGHLPEPDPRHHPTNEPRLFGQAEERVERPARHQPEIACVERDRRVGDPVEHAIESRRRRAFEHRLAIALAADGIDDIGLLIAHRRAHVGEQFGRILQIGVDDEDLRAAAQVEPGGQRQLVPVIAAEIDRDEAWIGGGQPLHHRPAVVAAAIVDENDLIIVAHRAARRRPDPRMEQFQARGLVVTGDDDR